MNSNDKVSDISSCPVCGGNHDVLVIGLENGGHIVTQPFPKEETTRVKVTSNKLRATKLNLVDIFWPEYEGDI